MNRHCYLDVGKGSLVGDSQVDKGNKMTDESRTASEGLSIFHLIGLEHSVQGRNGPCPVSSKIVTERQEPSETVKNNQCFGRQEGMQKVSGDLGRGWGGLKSWRETGVADYL